MDNYYWSSSTTVFPSMIQIIRAATSTTDIHHYLYSVCDISNPPFSIIPAATSRSSNNVNSGSEEQRWKNKFSRNQKKHSRVTESWKVRKHNILHQNPPLHTNHHVTRITFREALEVCQEVVIPSHFKLTTGPFNLTSHQVLTVNGVLQASTNKDLYPLVAPLWGYGWSNDKNCFEPSQGTHKIIVGALRYAPFIGSFDATNVTIRGIGTIDGNGQEWWDNCTKCHYDIHRNVNQSSSPSSSSHDPSYCLIASRPKLIETQFVTGFHLYGGTHAKSSSSLSQPPLILKNSPFWTVTPSYSQDIYVSNVRILAPLTKIGNTDGVNLDSCKNAILQHLYIENGDDGIAIKSGLNGFGLNLAIPTENVFVNNVTTYGRGGLAIGSELSGGVRNITFQNCQLMGSRGITFKPRYSRGGYIDNIHFVNITSHRKVVFAMLQDGLPLLPDDNHFVPLVSNIRFDNVSHLDLQHGFDDCTKLNQSKCFNVTADTIPNSPWKEPLPMPRYYACKSKAKAPHSTTLRFLPWSVCIPLDAPVNVLPTYDNWGPVVGNYSSLQACQQAC